MNEILCPNCGKSNPPETEFCENCLAPLKKENSPKPPSEPTNEQPSDQAVDQASENPSPTWLKRVRERSQAELPETPPLGEFGEAEKRPFDQPIAPGEIPDWLKEIQNNEPAQKAETHEPDADWVARLHEIQESSNKNPAQSTTFYSEDELAAMAAAARKQESQKQNLPEQVKNKNRNEYEDSWQQAIEEPAIIESPESGNSFSQPEGNQPEEPVQPIVEDFDSFEEEAPDWLKNAAPLEKLEKQATPEQSNGVESSSETQSEILFEPESEAQPETIPPTRDEIFPESDIPVREKKKSVLSSFFESNQTEPSAENDNQNEEPLIPEEVLQPQNSRAVEYSGRLEISASQQDSITLLKKMLVGEIQPLSPDLGRGKISGRFIRAVLGVLLLVVMGYPFFTGYLLVKPQALFSPGVVTMHNTITNLPENGHFLIVTDFEPAFSGEMKASATGVIDNLMMKGMNFTVISTVPSGPTLARNLFNSVRSGSFTYQPEKIAVLGFIPGGTTGLRDFVRNPRQAAPLLDSGAYAWTYPAAQAVNVIQDYAGVLVITENAETGRAWVEQLQGSLVDQPLLMVVSAQSAPIMRPYLDSRQLDGLIGGRVEGAMYDRLMDAPLRAAIEMSSYQMGMLFAAGLIILGGLFGILRKVFVRKPEGSTEEWHAG